MSREMQSALTNFKRCADEAPKGTYENTKSLNEVIGGAVDQLMRDIRALGLKADACDHAFVLEAAIYGYVKQSNPDCSLFPVSEGFGSAMDGPARDRVIAQTERDRDFIRSMPQAISDNG